MPHMLHPSSIISVYFSLYMLSSAWTFRQYRLTVVTNLCGGFLGESFLGDFGKSGTTFLKRILVVESILGLATVATPIHALPLPYNDHADDPLQASTNASPSASLTKSKKKKCPWWEYGWKKLGSVFTQHNECLEPWEEKQRAKIAKELPKWKQDPEVKARSERRYQMELARIEAMEEAKRNVVRNGYGRGQGVSAGGAQTEGPGRSSADLNVPANRAPQVPLTNEQVLPPSANYPQSPNNQPPNPNSPVSPNQQVQSPPPTPASTPVAKPPMRDTPQIPPNQPRVVQHNRMNPPNPQSPPMPNPNLTPTRPSNTNHVPQVPSRTQVQSQRVSGTARLPPQNPLQSQPTRDQPVGSQQQSYSNPMPQPVEQIQVPPNRVPNPNVPDVTYHAQLNNQRVPMNGSRTNGQNFQPNPSNHHSPSVPPVQPRPVDANKVPARRIHGGSVQGTPRVPQQQDQPTIPVVNGQQRNSPNPNDLRLPKDIQVPPNQKIHGGTIGGAQVQRPRSAADVRTATDGSQGYNHGNGYQPRVNPMYKRPLQNPLQQNQGIDSGKQYHAPRHHYSQNVQLPVEGSNRYQGVELPGRGSGVQHQPLPNQEFYPNQQLISGRARSPPRPNQSPPWMQYTDPQARRRAAANYFAGNLPTLQPEGGYLQQGQFSGVGGMDQGYPGGGMTGDYFGYNAVMDAGDDNDGLPYGNHSVVVQPEGSNQDAFRQYPDVVSNQAVLPVTPDIDNTMSTLGAPQVANGRDQQNLDYTNGF